MIKIGDKLIYEEKVSSIWTEVVFLTLMTLFFLLSIWRLITDRLDILTVVFFCLSTMFLFYSLNYRTLIIRMTEESLKLIFGVFTWRVPFENIAECHLDDLPFLMKYAGAGIHFMFVCKKYRASLNFLEHSRVVVRLKRKVGLVRDVSFSTCRPDELVQLIQGAITVNGAA